MKRTRLSSDCFSGILRDAAEHANFLVLLLVVVRSLSKLSVLWMFFSQLFALYETLPEPSVKKMEGVVNTGINVVASVYFLVGHCLKINQHCLVAGNSMLSLITEKSLGLRFLIELELK